MDARTVGEAVLAFVLQHVNLLGIDQTQLGLVRAADVSPDLWQVSRRHHLAGVREAADASTASLVEAAIDDVRITQQ
ncbi:MAG TPA: hypothetical protein VKK31_27330 [Thermoanaerobaculia bacterium]|nr:hypothetical protein [Thermoanaerobaculia bacterium]